jgi:RNA polymerase sigma factor (sigma-70 family)
MEWAQRMKSAIASVVFGPLIRAEHQREPLEEEGRMQNETSNVLNAFRQGDVDAFEVLFRQHQSAVYRWILRIVRNPAAAEDLTVETFWRIHRAHARFDPARGFEGWARRIATRAALDWLRGRRVEDALTMELSADPASPALADAAVTAEIRQKTAQAFGRLPPKLRIAAVLAVLEEQPHKDVAEALGVSVAAVKLRVFRALRLLRKDLEGQGIRP